MKICLMIEGQENVTWEQWRALAAACEEHGFDALFRSDHYTSFGHPEEWGSLDAWTTLAALGPLTSRIKLGTLVSPATFRHPALLAKSVVTADHASGGRVEVGIGAGWFEGEHRAYGFPFPPAAERVSMLAEQVEIVHRLLNHDEPVVSFEGQHYRLEDCHPLPKPVQQPHPWLLMGGQAGPKVAALAARWADEYNVHGKEPAVAREKREALDRACEAQGRDPSTLRFSIMTGTVVGSDQRELEARARRLMEPRGETGDPREFLERWGRNGIVGTPDQVLETLQAYADVGVERVMMQHLLHDDLEALALIGSEIIPEAARL